MRFASMFATQKMTRRTTRLQPGRPVEPLENRLLFAAAVIQPLGSLSPAAGATTSDVNLGLNFDDPAVNSQVTLSTEVGDINLTLFDAQKPITVRNFLRYVRRGLYDTTFIHRATDSNATGLGVVQGGGYTLPLTAVNHIETEAPIRNEFTDNGTNSNTRGTIAMAKTSDPNSATSEWFINTTDNSTALDDTRNSGGFTVFGEVTAGTLANVDAVAALPTFAYTPPGVPSQFSPFGELPLRNYTSQDLTAGTVPTANNVVITDASVAQKLTYTAVSDNPALVNPNVNGEVLTLQYGAGSGSANVVVTATDANGGTTSDTLAVSVGSVPITVGQGGARSVSFTDADGTIGTVSVKGPGAATVNFNGSGLMQDVSKNRITVTGTGVGVASIDATATTDKTTILVTARKGNGSIDIGGLTTSGPVRAISAKQANLIGPLTTGGAPGRIDFGTATGASLTLNGSGSDKPATVSFRTATSTDITSSVPLKSVSATAFSGNSTGGQPAGQGIGTISAPFVRSISSRADFVQNVAVTGDARTVNIGGNFIGNLSADSINKLSVKGNMSGSTLTITRPFANREQPLKNVNVKGTIDDSVFRVSGNIGNITASSMSGSTIFAGIAATVAATSLPSSATDYAAQAQVRNLNVRNTFGSSTIAAFDLPKLKLGTLQTVGTAAPFGLAADRIGSAKGQTDAGVKFNLRRLDTPTDVAQATTGLDLQNFQVSLI